MPEDKKKIDFAVKVDVIQKVVSGNMDQSMAARMLMLSDRQVRRIIKRFREEGSAGLVHRLKWKISNRIKNLHPPIRTPKIS